VTNPYQILKEGKYKALPDHVTKVVAVMHDRDHYAMMEIDIHEKMVVIYNGLYRELDKWIEHVVRGMKQCMFGMVQAWVGQKRLKRDIFKTFFDVQS
jgi:hypothetical protein